MIVRPLGSRVLIERTPSETVSAGGLIIPSMAQEQRAEGTVLAVGKGARDRTTGARIPTDVKAGDVVIFTRHAGCNTTINGRELILVESDQCVAVLEEE